MIITKVGRKGQIAVPKGIRQGFGIEEEDSIAFVRRGKEIILQPLTRTLLDLRGSVAVSEPQEFAAIRHQVLAEHARKVVGDDA
jgi:AbrB family looped-hinge helix DNA binding protein